LAASWLVTITSTLTIGVALALVGIFFVFSSHVGRIFDDLSASLRLTVYLKADTPEPEMVELKRSLEEIESIRAVTFVDDRDIEAEIREILGSDVVEGIPREALPLQPALEIDLAPRHLDKEAVTDLLSWVATLKAVDWVDDVVHSIGTYRIVLVLIESVGYLVLLLTVIVTLSALFFVYSTIRLSVLARADEISVMRLVGATRSYVRIPFFIQGGIQGLVAGVLAVVGLALLDSHVTTTLAREYLLTPGVDLLPPGSGALLLLAGVALGLVGTWMSVGKYLKV